MRDEFWPVVLSLLMVVAIILELLTPTMGGFTFGAMVLGISSSYLAFKVSQSFGFLMVAMNVALFPLTLWLGLRLIRKSPLIHNTELNAGIQSSPDAPPLTHLMGKEGKAITPLRPGGSVLIEGTKVDVLTQGKYVDVGATIRVIAVEGSKVVVEQAG